jgi:hypothetical protein
VVPFASANSVSPHHHKSHAPSPPTAMNNMLELSKYADYDFIAALAIFGFALLAKFWEPLRKHLNH